MVCTSTVCADALLHRPLHKRSLCRDSAEQAFAQAQSVQRQCCIGLCKGGRSHLKLVLGAAGARTVVHPKARIIAEAGPVIIGEFNIIEELVHITNR